MPATAETTHDVVVLGGGSGGYACALRAAELGLTVALVEKDLLGGTCLHRGCIPTKALLHAAEVADAAREASRFGVRATLDGIDMAGVTSYRQGVVSRLHKGLQGLVKSRKVDYVEGEGRLEDGRTVVVGDRRLVGRHVVLATGSYAAHPPRPRDRRPGHDERPGARARRGPRARRRPRRWRHRRRVRLRHALVRRRRHGRRGAPPARRRRGPRVLHGPRARVQQARHHGAHRRPVRVGHAVRRRRHRHPRGRRDPRGRPPPRRRRPRAVHGRTGVRGGRRGARPRLRHRRRPLPHLGRGRLGGRRHRPRAPARAPRLRAGHLRRRVDRRALAGRRSSRARSPGSPTASPRSRRSASPRSRPARRTATRSRPTSTTSAATARARSSRPRASSSSCGVTDGPVVGIHMVGSRMGEQVGEAQLVVGWEAHPEDVAALVHAHPTQNEALGEAHMALAGKPLHAHN